MGREGSRKMRKAGVPGEKRWSFPSAIQSPIRMPGFVFGGVVVEGWMLEKRPPMTIRPRVCKMFLTQKVDGNEKVQGASMKTPQEKEVRSRDGRAMVSKATEGDEEKDSRPKRKLTAETKARISASMVGKKKSDEMKAKVSRALKGRVPWNKGKKLTIEVRKRMSFARFGRAPWNKGQQLSEKHRKKISEKMTGREVSAETKRKLKMARRRPGDNVVVSSKSPEPVEEGNFSLVRTIQSTNKKRKQAPAKPLLIPVANEGNMWKPPPLT